VTHPIVTLKSDADIRLFTTNLLIEFEELTSEHKEQFHSHNEHYSIYETKYRALAFFHNKNQYPKLFRRFKEAGENLANRDDIRVAVVTDRTTVAKWLKEV
jgi:hypothetical protein